MAMYSVSTLSILTTTGANNPLVAFRGSTTDRCYVREIGITYVTLPTGNGNLGLVRSTALAVTPTGTVVGQPHHPDDTASTAQLETGWGTAPTISSTTYLKKFNGGTAIGNGIVWRFDEGLGLAVPLGSAVNGELVICNLAGNVSGTFHIWVSWDE